MSDKAERFRTLSLLFDELVELDAGERAALIRERCAHDPGLEHELRVLLRADAAGDAHAFVAGVVGSEAAVLAEPKMHGVRLGSWRIARPLGEGGMGTVYLAERADGEYEAAAAVKLVRGGLMSPALTERFRSERQILAGLSHPGVAQLIDGGSTDDGTPYLVMELVEGRPITDWCDERELDVDDRLKLFLKVCDSVAYAHAALVAHRDLKPSNILVTEDGEAKLLDFGVAKLMDAMTDGAETVTQTYGAMTPAYASPEQMSGERAGVSADVYSLGVLLFELLTGRLPLETGGLTPIQVISKVTHEVPPIASATVTDRGRKRRLSGDLDTITSRALRKEPGERYPSVEALAEDVRLHLSGLPIKARRDDWRYRTTKLARRNRGVVSGGVLMLMLMVSFTVNAIVQARAVAQERDRAEAQRERAERVSAFLEEMLTEADPNEASALDVTARELLDRGAGRILDGLAAEPEIQAALATVMGRVYRNLGEYDAALVLLDSALAVRRAAPGRDAAAYGEGLLERGALAYDMGEYERAVDLSRTALETYETVVTGDDPRIASATDWLSASLMELGRMEEAERWARSTVDMYRRLDAEPNGDLGSALTSLSDVLRGRGAFAEALGVGQEALTITRLVYGDQHLEVSQALNHLASTLNRAGRAEEAIPYVEESLRIGRATFAGPHVETGATLGNLANIYQSVGRLEEAEAARRESVAILRAIFPEPHPYVAASTNSLGSLLAEMGRTAEAERLLGESVDLHRIAFPPDHPNIGYPLTALGRIHISARRFEAAETVLREAYDARSGGLPDRHWHIAASGLELGRALDGLGRVEEAQALLEESHSILLETFGAEDERTARAREALSEHWTRRGLPDRAAGLRDPAGGGP